MLCALLAGASIAVIAISNGALSSPGEREQRRTEGAATRIVGPLHPGPDVTCWATTPDAYGDVSLTCYPTPKSAPGVGAANEIEVCNVE